MIWVTWRQHRAEAAWTLLFAALLAASTGFLAWQVAVAAPNCGPVIGQEYCFSGDLLGRMAQAIVQFNLSQYGLVVLPALAGAFIGAPLIAREVENGTHRLAWTQGVTRLRWLMSKSVLVFVPVLLMAAVAGIVEVILLNVQGGQVNRWNVFDQQAPLIVASTFFALALGIALGALIGRSIPAMAATLVVFVAVRVVIGVLIRPHFMAPVQFRTTDFSTIGQTHATAWYLSDGDYYDAAGHVLSNGPRAMSRAAYVVQSYQPGDRFWAFQSIESAILTVLALALVAFAIYWVSRRVS